MDKLVEHAIRMLEIVEGENDFYCNDAKRQADIARAVYDTILRVQILEHKFDKDINVRSKDEPNSSEIPNNCEDDEYWKHLFIEVAEGRMSDAGANQAWYEHINHKDEPQTDCPFGEDDKCFGCGDNTKCVVFDEPQTERSE